MRGFIIRYFPFILVLLLILLAALFEFFFRSDISYKNPGLIAESQISVWIEKVGRLAILPQDEIPSIATVSSPETLKNQAFFTDAKKGDIVLIYKNSKKAILYDPTIDKIITMATVNIGDNSKPDDLLQDLPKGPAKSISSGTENQF